MFGAIYYIVPRLTGREWASSNLIRIHFWGTFLGVMLMFFVLTVGGLIQGLEMNQASESWHELVGDEGLWQGTRRFFFGYQDPETGETLAGFKRQNGAVPFMSIVQGTVPWLTLRSRQRHDDLRRACCLRRAAGTEPAGTGWRRGPALVQGRPARLRRNNASKGDMTPVEAIDELRYATIFIGVFLTFSSAWLGLVFFPYQQLGSIQPQVDEVTGETNPPPYSGLELVGRKVYIDEGCHYCHSQQVRGGYWNADLKRGWGPRRSVPLDYVHDNPALLGTMRTGPDLINIGARQPSAAWHYLHLYNPQITSAGSIMPPHPFLFERRPLGGSRCRRCSATGTESGAAAWCPDRSHGPRSRIGRVLEKPQPNVRHRINHGM